MLSIEFYKTLRRKIKSDKQKKKVSDFLLGGAVALAFYFFVAVLAISAKLWAVAYSVFLKKHQNKGLFSGKQNGLVLVSFSH